MHALANINREFERRARKLQHKLKLAEAMMEVFKSKNTKKLEELTSQARKAGINLYLDLEEMEGLLESWAKLAEKMKKAARDCKVKLKHKCFQGNNQSNH